MDNFTLARGKASASPGKSLLPLAEHYERPKHPLTIPFQLLRSKGQYQSEFMYQRTAFPGDDPARNHAEQLSMFANARRLTDQGSCLAWSVWSARSTIIFRVVRMRS